MLCMSGSVLIIGTLYGQLVLLQLQFKSLSLSLTYSALALFVHFVRKECIAAIAATDQASSGLVTRPTPSSSALSTFQMMPSQGPRIITTLVSTHGPLLSSWGAHGGVTVHRERPNTHRGGDDRCKSHHPLPATKIERVSQNCTGRQGKTNKLHLHFKGQRGGTQMQF
jgi:hypothetical protein